MVTAQGRKSENMDTNTHCAATLHHDNVKDISSLSSLYWGTETVFAPGPSTGDLYTKLLTCHVILTPQKVPRPLKSKSMSNHSVLVISEILIRTSCSRKENLQPKGYFLVRSHCSYWLSWENQVLVLRLAAPTDSIAKWPSALCKKYRGYNSISKSDVGFSGNRSNTKFY